MSMLKEEEEEEVEEEEVEECWRLREEEVEEEEVEEEEEEVVVGVLVVVKRGRSVSRTMRMVNWVLGWMRRALGLMRSSCVGSWKDLAEDASESLRFR